MQMNSGAQNASLTHNADLGVLGNGLSFFNRDGSQMEIANDYILRLASILVQTLFVLNRYDVTTNGVHATSNYFTVARCINRSIALNGNRIVTIMGTAEYRAVLSVHISQDWCSGITLTGGDPLSLANIWDTMRLIDAVKKAFPNKNIWVYTGSSWDTVKRKPGMEQVDVLVDGEYIDELKSPDKHWVGSSNQNVIDVKVSIRENKLVLWKEG